MREFDLIARLVPQLASNQKTVVGAGDDCALLDVGIAQKLLLFKTDAVVEGVHFTRESGWRRVGRKAICRCLSDVAAMAGEPLSALVTLGLPAEFDVSAVDELYAGLNERALEFGVSISGGETVRSTGGLFLSVSMVGWVPRGRLFLRKNLQAGDALFVTGELGGSLLGKHLDFTPRLAEASWLAEHCTLHAMMDVSDGLAGDLQRLMEASGVGVRLLSEAIPLSTAARTLARQGEASALTHAMNDGEDFELLFSIPPGEAVSLLDRWKERFPGLKLSCIGKAVPEKGITLVSRKSGPVQWNGNGYDHFQ